MAEEKKKREEYKTTIGPGLKNILKQIKENMLRACYGCVKGSDYDAGEILTKKVEEIGGIKPCNKNLI